MNNSLLLILKTISLIVFVSLIPALFLLDHSTTLVWTIVIPLVPILFITLGYSNWRNICPLAFFSKISQNLNWVQKRKVPQWFENNFYFFQYFLLFSAFTARLLLLNYENIYLGIFFILVVISAFTINLFFTGKSWCNFFCPVGIVEKIYCGSNAHNYDNNSSCSKCSACKKNCPDIDMESNYWKESVNMQKTAVFYSFSGLVLGFYLYFYLQSGSFSYYFSGSWAHDTVSLLGDGFFFAPIIPVFIAAPLTLALFSFLSYYLIKTLEQFLWKKKFFKNVDYITLTHRVKVISAFVAFNIFYAFAGAPAYLHYPLFYALFHFLVVAMSAIILHREIFREESYFIQERFAIKMIKRWDSDKPIPTNLKEIYYTYANEKKNKEQQLQTYKDTLIDLLQEGILTEESMVILEKLREQIGISQKEHFNVIRAIKLNNEDLFDANIEKSAERRYQRASYKKMLEDTLNKDIEINSPLLKSIQKQFYITNQEHKEIMDEILNSNKKLQNNVLSLLEQMFYLTGVHERLHNDNTREINFLKYTIRNEFNIISQELFALLELIYEDNKEDLTLFKNICKYTDSTLHIELSSNKLSFMDPKISDALLALDQYSQGDVIENKDNLALLHELVTHDSLALSTIALLNMQNYPHESQTEINHEKFLLSEDTDVIAVSTKISSQSNEITIYHEMMYLHNIPLFAGIKFDDLNNLAHSTEVVEFTHSEEIIVQGDIGNSLFVILSGTVDVIIDGIIVNHLGEEDYFGEIAIIADTPRTATVKSTTNVSILKLSTNAFKTFIYDNPGISIILMKEITHRLLQNKK